MKSFRALLFSMLAIVGCTAATQPIDTSGLAEASMNLDQEHVGPLLTEISGLFPTGFPQDAAARVTDQVDGLWVGQSGNWEFSVTFNGQPARLVIAAHKDDSDAPDLYFFSSPEVAAQINRQLVVFSEAHGI
ncbi:hypothetical protein [Luteimonas arsenica]|uniref:hypothetical protein n=1 Tax=Luteimonas arsenica TaxID=1586242 RepID=UPI001054EF9A|nr:hypothetical protein [Luteimonas arsenica]